MSTRPLLIVCMILATSVSAYGYDSAQTANNKGRRSQFRSALMGPSRRSGRAGSASPACRMCR